MTILECIKAAAYGALGALVIMFFYEGIPGAYRIPYLSSIPIIGTFTTGEKHAYAAEQVKNALKDMVTRSELDAATARAVKAERESRFNATQADLAQKALQAARETEKAQNERYDQAVKGDTDDDGARVSQRDIDWLLRNAR